MAAEPLYRYNRGACPVCGRNVALLSDGTVGRQHVGVNGLRCPGYGGRAKLLNLPAPIKIRKHRASGRWQVFLRNRRDGNYRTAKLAYDRVAELHDGLLARMFDDMTRKLDTADS